jgi:hypothetical protein
MTSLEQGVSNPGNMASNLEAVDNIMGGAFVAGSNEEVIVDGTWERLLTCNVDPQALLGVKDRL